MSKYKYFSMHDLKDCAMIYHEPEWDGAKICLWDPKTQRKLDMYFTGSSRPGVKSPDDPGEVNFNVRYIDKIGENGVFDAFDEVVEEMKKCNFDMSIDWRDKFMEYIFKNRE